MLELLINPKRGEKNPWEMVIIGFVYASISVLAAHVIFSGDSVLYSYSGIFIVTFCMALSLPFVYFVLKQEEKKDEESDEEATLLKEHGKAILALLWLFIGYVLAFSLFYILFPNGHEFFRAQIQVFCQMNRPDNYEQCLQQYGIENSIVAGKVILSEAARVVYIFSNNVKVLMLTLLFSLAAGAGAIFILAWNASVIASAIGIFANSDIRTLHIALARYLIHGIPEISAYFIAALAGGILSMAVIRKGLESEKRWNILNDVLFLVVIALIILFISALIEVFITPQLF